MRLSYLSFFVRSVRVGLVRLVNLVVAMFSKAWNEDAAVSCYTRLKSRRNGGRDMVAR
jgi:hypothetical protein